MTNKWTIINEVNNFHEFPDKSDARRKEGRNIDAINKYN